MSVVSRRAVNPKGYPCLRYAECEECPLSFGGCPGNLVPGKYIGKQGEMKYMVIGEAPGREEVRDGEPFIGRSGRLLRYALERLGILEQCYLTNSILCHPPKNRDPDKKELKRCYPRLLKEIDDVRPEVIIAAGKVSIDNLIGREAEKSKEHVGTVYKVKIRGRLYPVIHILHPAFILRNVGLAEYWYDTIRLHLQIAEHPPLLPNVGYNVPHTPEAAIDLLKWLREDPDAPICLDLETTSTDTLTCKLLCVALSTGERTVIIPAEIAFKVGAALLDLIRHHQIVGQNLHFDSMVMMYKFGPEFMLHDTIDTLHVAQAMHPRTGGHNLESLLLLAFGYPNYKAKFWEKSKAGKASDADLYRYAAQDAAFTLALSQYYQKEADDDHWRAHEMMRKVSYNVQSIEYMGVQVDREYALAKKREYLVTAADMQERIEELSKGEIKNPGSADQVGEHLFGTLKVRPPKRVPHLTPTGKRSTKKVVLDALPADVEVANLIKEYRRLVHWSSTFIDGALAVTDDNDVLHPKYKVMGTTTGRLSSHDPNTQNFPVECRGIFTARPGYVLAEVDYCQLEVRVGLVLAQDEAGLELATSQTSVHKQVSQRVYGDVYTPEQYRRCKSVVFEIMYGGDDPKVISGKLDIKLGEAKELIRLVHSVVPGYIKWRAWIRESVRTNKPPYVTPFGRHRDFPIISKDNIKDVMNECINFPVQSTASDICQLNTYRLLTRVGWIARNTTHDSLLVELPERDMDRRLVQVVKYMQSPISLFGRDIVFPVEVKVGQRWGQLTEVHVDV